MSVGKRLSNDDRVSYSRIKQHHYITSTIRHSSEHNGYEELVRHHSTIIRSGGLVDQ